MVDAVCSPGLEELVCAVARALETMDTGATGIGIEGRYTEWGIELRVRIAARDGDGTDD